MLVGDTVVGHAGQLHPAVIERSGLPKGTCAAELNLDAIPFSESLPAPAVSPFPAVFQDVALIVDEAVAAQSVVDAVRDGAGELLEDVRLFDVYTGPQIGDGRKSLALALRFRATDRTLTEDEASAARDAAVATAAERVGAEQRRRESWTRSDSLTFGWPRIKRFFRALFLLPLGLFLVVMCPFASSSPLGASPFWLRSAGILASCPS